MIKLTTIMALAVTLAPGVAMAQAPVAPSLGEAHARSAMTAYGCNNVSSLSAGPAGSWHGQCVKGGALINAVMDSNGTVTTGGVPSHITEPMARSTLTGAGCNSVTALSPGPANSWHGQCVKGGATVNAMVDGKGVATTGQPVAHITEAHARSILTSAGCSNISTLSAGTSGNWSGQCAKGGKTSNVSVDSKGASTFN